MQCKNRVRIPVRRSSRHIVNGCDKTPYPSQSDTGCASRDCWQVISILWTGNEQRKQYLGRQQGRIADLLGVGVSAAEQPVIRQQDQRPRTIGGSHKL